MEKALSNKSLTLKLIHRELYLTLISYQVSLEKVQITECNKIGKILNGGLLIQITMPKGTNAGDIKKVIEKGASITSSFKPVMQASICGNCGFKDEELGDKCPACKSTYII